MKKFKISSVQSETLNWSLGLFLAFSLVNSIGDVGGFSQVPE